MNTVLKNCIVSLCICLYATTLMGDSIPFEVRNGLVIVKAKINNVEGNFVLDTGSSDLLLNDTSPLSTTTFATASKEISGEVVKVDNIYLGEIRFKSVEGFKMDLSSVSTYAAMEIKGIIGARLLKPYGVVIDFTSNHIRLITYGEDHHITDNMISLPFEMINDVPVVEIRIDGSLYQFILDSGATSHFIDQSVIERYQGLFDDTGMDARTFSTDNDNGSAKIYYMQCLVIGDSVNNDIRVIAGEFKHLMSDTQISGLISMWKLSDDRIYLDNKHDVVYFD